MKRLSPEKRKRIIHLWEETDLTQTAIANEVGCNQWTVSKVLSKHIHSMCPPVSSAYYFCPWCGKHLKKGRLF